MRTTLAAIAALGAWTGSGSAVAQQFPTQDPAFASPHFVGAGLDKIFGDAGGVAIRGAFDLGVFYRNFQRPGVAAEAYAQTSLKVAPALDFFLAKNFALGGLIELGYSTGKYPASAISGAPTDALLKQSHLAFAVGPEIGYNFAAMRHASVFPTLSGVYRITSVSGPIPAGGTASTSGYSISVIGRIPFLYHLASRFFVGFGPTISVDVVRKYAGRDDVIERALGLDFEIGGWL